MQAGQHGVGSSTPNTPTGILPEDFGRQGAGPGRGAFFKTTREQDLLAEAPSLRRLAG